MLHILLATDAAFGIGNAGDLLFHIPADLKQFRRLTTGQIIVMGRKTLDSLPGGRALPKRDNIVLTRDVHFTRENITPVADTPALLKALRTLDPHEEKEHYLIGGAGALRALWPLCGKATLTVLRRTCDPVDTRIPNLDVSPDWMLESETDPVPFEETFYTVRTYRRLHTESGARPLESSPFA
uniref:dihydrofolate reductase n=1 Tax=Ndongobacter massiliensis TaxID=1871025 RepID=UPI00093066A7|nr:dihydrofolate reductase [Ndongobacter massiliensis]